MPVLPSIFSSEQSSVSGSEDDQEDVANTPKENERDGPRQSSTLNNFSQSYDVSEESSALLYFVSKAAPELASCSNEFFWKIQLPQSSWRNPAIKHALIALSLTHRQMSFGHLENCPGNLAEQSLLHYTKSVQILVGTNPCTAAVLTAGLCLYTCDTWNDEIERSKNHLLALRKVCETWADHDQNTTSKDSDFRSFITSLVGIIEHASTYLMSSSNTKQFER